jgi:hypothetical protein
MRTIVCTYSSRRTQSKSTAEILHAQKITIRDELMHLINVYPRQAMFHDWIVAKGVNQKIRSLDQRASQLAEVMAARSLDVGSLLKASSEPNALLMGNEEPERLARLQEQYGGEYDKVNKAAGSQAAKGFLSALATLEAAAHLEAHDKMKIVAVIADPRKDLAGSELSTFVGFFKKSYREHDYWVGRKKTRKSVRFTFQNRKISHSFALTRGLAAKRNKRREDILTYIAMMRFQGIKPVPFGASHKWKPWWTSAD